MIEVIDQMKRCVQVPSQPERIISLVPSQTELLCELGLGERLVGITKFCIHPKGLIKEKSVVGGTKDFKMEKIKALKPDLIIGNKEENQKELIEALAEEFPVWMSDISTLEESFEMIKLVGELVDCGANADKIVAQATKGFLNLNSSSKGTSVYLIWNNPIMTAGKGTFIDDMLRRIGLENLVLEDRYPELSEERLKSLAPDYLLLSSEPFPFKENHIQRFRELLPNAKIELVDGEMFSWYGSRILKAPSYFEGKFEKY